MGNKKLQIGITGGIGSGKTTVCRIFEALGIPVYYADDRAKWLMANDPALKAGIKNVFGEQVYDENGQLDRTYLAGIVFKDPDKLQELNQLVHPAVGLDGERWHQQQKDVPYTLKEAALIFESGSFRLLDKVITVFAPKALRLQRVMDRDKVPAEAVEARMARQLSEEEKMARADFIIYNDGSRPLIQQVWTLHQELIKIIEPERKE